MRKQASEKLAERSSEGVKSLKPTGRKRQSGRVRGKNLHKAKQDLAEYPISDCAKNARKNADGEPIAPIQR